MRTNARYWLLALDCERAEFGHRPELAMALDGPARTAIQERCQAARAQGRLVENHPLYRLLDWRVEREALLLETGAVDYETYFGLSQLQSRPTDGPRSWVPEPERAVVLAVAATTEVGVGLVLEERGQRVAQGAGMQHVKPSGHIHPPQTAWDALLAETEEELGIVREELRACRMLGAVLSLTAPCVVLLYSLETDLQWEELLRRRPVDAWEFERLIRLPLGEESLEGWLVESFAQRATGPGHAAVLLEGRRRYGDAWFERVWSRLVD